MGRAALGVAPPTARGKGKRKKGALRLPVAMGAVRADSNEDGRSSGTQQEAEQCLIMPRPGRRDRQSISPAAPPPAPPLPPTRPQPPRAIPSPL